MGARPRHLLASARSTADLVELTFRDSTLPGYWDVTANLEHKDTAYTTLAIAPHMDSTYNAQPAPISTGRLLPAGSAE